MSISTTARAWCVLFVAGWSLAVLVEPASAQLDEVVHGRVVDAASGGPVAGVRVIAPDSSSAVFTDSLGVFALPVAPPVDAGFGVSTERIGYLAQRYPLGEGATERINVLMLEPAPLEIEGIDVVDEAALTTLVRRLEQRRRSYPYSMRAFDRSGLQRFAPTGSVLDFVRQRVLGIRTCPSDPSRLCTPGPYNTLSVSETWLPVLVCVDGVEAISHESELSSIETALAATVELYTPSRDQHQIRVYTLGWMTWSARNDQTAVTPLQFGC